MSHTPGVAMMMAPTLIDLMFDTDALDRLASHTELLTPTPLANAAELAELDAATLARVEVLLTSWGCPQLDESTVALVPNLKLVAHAAGTVKGLVSDALFASGTTVVSAAAANAVPVAEFTFAAIVMCGKEVFTIRDRHRAVSGEGSAVRGLDLGNRGRTIGIVGASLIGRMVIERLRSIDCTVLVYDPYLSAAEASELGVAKTTLDELCETSDVVSLHAPALTTTRHMIAAPQLALMRRGSWLINTARGSLVDTAALETEVVAGRINAFIDTPDPEPLPADSPLYNLPNVVLTPHIAGSLGNEIARMGALAVTEIERFAAGQPPLHPVTVADLDRIA